MNDIVEDLPEAGAMPPAGAALSGLPFTFAKQFNVLLEREDGQPRVIYQGRPDIGMLTELRRVIGEPFTLDSVPEEEFQRRLSLAYQRGNNEAVQMA